MSVLESILSMFRRKPGESPSIDPSPEHALQMRPPSINSIALSPDMSTLFLIDNGRAIYFDLSSRFGIVIGTLDGQLTVATALPDIVPVEDDPDTPEPPDTPPGGPDDPIERIIPDPRPRTLRLSTQSFKWNFLFVPIKGKEVFSIIGASDIDASIIGASDIDASITTRDAGTDGGAARATEASAQCRIFSFLIANKSINIKREGEQLVINY